MTDIDFPAPHVYRLPESKPDPRIITVGTVTVSETEIMVAGWAVKGMTLAELAEYAARWAEDHVEALLATIATLRADSIATLRADSAATIDQWADALTTIAALRAALEPAQRLVDVIFAEAQAEPFILPLRGMRAAGDLRAALAALAAAKETP